MREDEEEHVGTRRSMWARKKGTVCDGTRAESARMGRNIWASKRKIWASKSYIWASMSNIWASNSNIWASKRNIWASKSNIWASKRNIWPSKRTTVIATRKRMRRR